MDKTYAQFPEGYTIRPISNGFILKAEMPIEQPTTDPIWDGGIFFSSREAAVEHLIDYLKEQLDA